MNYTLAARVPKKALYALRHFVK